MKKFIAIILTACSLFLLCGCNPSSDKNNTCYHLTIALNEDYTASCRLKLDYVNNINGLDYLVFNLYANAFSSTSKISPVYPEYEFKAYPNGVDYGGVDIKGVFIDGKQSDFSYLTEEKTHLKINLLSPLNNGDTVKVIIDFEIEIPNVKHRFGYADNTVNLSGFYPVLCVFENGEYYLNTYYPSGDPFYSNVADYKVELTVPSEYVVASSMSPISTVYFGGKTKYEYARKNVRDIAFVLSKKFNVLKQNVSDIKVYYYYFKDENAEKSLQTAIKNLEYFSGQFCKYPYSEYVVCQADFLYGGMEYPCLTMIDYTLKGFDKDYCITHETAHQWWYGLVGNNQAEESYIDEGLTEYSTLMFFDEFKEYNHTKTMLINEIKNIYADVRKNLLVNGVKDSKMLKNLGEFSSDLEYVSIAYYRSQIMLYELNEFMGDKRFNKFLKSIIKGYKYKNVTTENLIKLAQKSKRGSEKLLANYLSGTEKICGF